MGATLLGVAAFAVVWAAGADYRERSLFASAMVGSLAAASIVELVRNGGLRRERSRLIGVSMASVAVLCQVIRVPLLLALPSGDGALLSGSLEQSVAFFPAMVHVLGVGLGFLVMHVERTEGQALQAAMTDPLTGCANRRAFTVQVDDALKTARSGQSVGILLTDIDRFKAVNDTHGHAVGDVVIRHFAAVLREGVRTSDVMARLGGEEFCVLLRGTDLAGAEALAMRLGDQLREHPAREGGATIRVTASFGVATARPDEDWAALFARADRALYEAKSAGRDRVIVA